VEFGHFDNVLATVYLLDKKSCEGQTVCEGQRGIWRPKYWRVNPSYYYYYLDVFCSELSELINEPMFMKLSGIVEYHLT